MISKMAQFEDDASCHAYHLGLGKDTFLLKGKDLMGYVTEQVQLWVEKRQLIQQREDKIKEANLARKLANEVAARELARDTAQVALARENTEREITLARETAERELAREAAQAIIARKMPKGKQPQLEKMPRGKQF